MKRTSVLSMLLFAAITLLAQTGTKNFIDQPYIEVKGKAEMEIIPDIIYLRIIIDEKDNKAKVSLEAKEKSMLQVLHNIGVDTKNEVSVIDYASNFKAHWIKATNIMTSKEYEVLVHNGKMVARVFIELEKLEISNISVNRLDHSKIEEYREQVKINAIKAAKSKAQNLLTAIDEKAGKALYIQEINRNIYPSRDKMEANVFMKVKSNATAPEGYIPDVEFQKLNLEYEILARFAID